MLKIKLTRSLIGAKKNQIACAHTLGLTKIGKTVTQPDNVQTRGKISKILHLVSVEKC